MSGDSDRPKAHVDAASAPDRAKVQTGDGAPERKPISQHGHIGPSLIASAPSAGQPRPRGLRGFPSPEWRRGLRQPARKAHTNQPFFRRYI